MATVDAWPSRFEVTTRLISLRQPARRNFDATALRLAFGERFLDCAACFQCAQSPTTPPAIRAYKDFYLLTANTFSDGFDVTRDALLEILSLMVIVASIQYVKAHTDKDT